MLHPASRHVYAVQGSSQLQWWHDSDLELKQRESAKVSSAVHSLHTAHSLPSAVVVAHADGGVAVYHQNGTRLAACSADSTCGAAMNVDGEGGAGPVLWAALHRSTSGVAALDQLLMLRRASSGVVLSVVEVRSEKGKAVLNTVASHVLEAPSKASQTEAPRCAFGGQDRSLTLVWSPAKAGEKTSLWQTYQFPEGFRGLESVPTVGLERSLKGAPYARLESYLALPRLASPKVRPMQRGAEIEPR